MYDAKVYVAMFALTTWLKLRGARSNDMDPSNYVNDAHILVHDTNNPENRYHHREPKYDNKVYEKR